MTSTAQNLSMDQLVGFILNEENNLDSKTKKDKTPISQDLSHYYDCTSGWNPVWLQNKTFFEKKLIDLHSSG